MNRSLLVLAATLTAVAVLPAPQPAQASCAAPYLDLGEGRAFVPGEQVAVSGDAFVDGCRDTMSCSGVLGCQSCQYDDPPPVPYDDVTLRLVQDGRRWNLGVVDADESGGVRWQLEVPAALRPGPARLETDRSEPVRLRIR